MQRNFMLKHDVEICQEYNLALSLMQQIVMLGKLTLNKLDESKHKIQDVNFQIL